MDVKTLFDLDGKTALVTGGSRGIGLMIAEGLVGAGARVHICARKADELEAAKAALAPLGGCKTHRCDVSQGADIRKLAEEIGAEEGLLHILVNNAGTSWMAPLDVYPEEGFDKVLKVNVTGPFQLIQQLLPLLEKASGPVDPARIIDLTPITQPPSM